MHNAIFDDKKTKELSFILFHNNLVIKMAPNSNGKSTNLVQTYSNSGRMVAHHGLSFVTNLTVLKSFFSFFRADLDFLLK